MSFHTNCLTVFLVLSVSVPAIAQATPKRAEENQTTVSAKQKGLSLSVSTPAKCTAGGPITLTCIIDNQTSGPIRYYASGGRDYAFQISIVDSRGKEVPP